MLIEDGGPAVYVNRPVADQERERFAALVDELVRLRHSDSELLDGQRRRVDASREQSHELEADERLDDPLARGWLRQHYQPVVDLVTGEVVCFEALTRWQHPTAGVLTADDLIPLAEASGFIGQLGTSLLQEACREAAAWNHLTGRSIGVAVNFSTQQLASPDLLVHFSAALETSGLEPSLLTIEITEGSAVTQAMRRSGVLEILRRLGVRVMIDDFGVGYSLDSLRRLHADGFKIDRRFVVDLDEARDPRAVAIVVAMLKLAHATSLEVIAEGIETAAQRDRLIELGCRRGQGYLFARPMPADAVVEFLARGPAPGRIPPTAGSDRVSDDS
jgi:diguanylate cyclase